MLPGDLGLKWQLPVKKDKDRVIAHRGKQKVKGHSHTHNTSRLGFFLRTSLIAGAISPLKSWPKCLHNVESTCRAAAMARNLGSSASGREMSSTGSFASAVSRVKSEEVGLSGGRLWPD